MIVYAERTIKYEIEVEPSSESMAIFRARAAIEDEAREGVLSFWEDEQPLDFDVERLSG